MDVVFACACTPVLPHSSGWTPEFGTGDAGRRVCTIGEGQVLRTRLLVRGQIPFGGSPDLEWAAPTKARAGHMAAPAARPMSGIKLTPIARQGLRGDNNALEQARLPASPPVREPRAGLRSDGPARDDSDGRGAHERGGVRAP